MTDTTTQDPAAIERDIRQTQDRMSQTVDRIGDQLSAKNLFNALLDKADDNGVDARMLLDGARRNPIALGLIAAGAIWLISDKDSKLPSLPKSKDDDWTSADADHDVHHRDYVSHMSSVEQSGDEDFAAYQRRRDTARSNFLMVERNHDEEESSFRQRLDAMSDRFRDKRRAWSSSASDAGVATRDTAQAAATATRDTAQAAATKAQDFYAGNPLVGGILAAAIGAAVGASIPVSRQEQEKLGGIGEKARDALGEQAEMVGAKVREQKDALLDKADEKISQVGAKTDARSEFASTDTGSASDYGDSKPFIAGS